MAVTNTTATTAIADLSQPSGLRVVHPETVTKINIDGVLRTGEGNLHGVLALTNSIGIDRMVRTCMGRETTNDPTKRSRRARGLQQSRQATRRTRQAQTTARLSASSQDASQNPLMIMELASVRHRSTRRRLSLWLALTLLSMGTRMAEDHRQCRGRTALSSGNRRHRSHNNDQTRVRSERAGSSA